MITALKPYIAAALITSSAFCSVNVATASANNELPLKSVVITTSGLALYQHQGTVNGNEDLKLSVRLDGVDDVLKSLVVLDSTGTLGGVSLPGRSPLSQLFRDLPFSKNDLQSLVGLLNALRGAAVELDIEKISGNLMSVSAENESTSDGIITRHRLSVLTKDGIKTAIIEDLGHLKFTDPEINAQLQYGLEALYDNRIQDRRNLDISLKGTGKRDVSFAYIQEAPLWKSSYRLIAPKKGASKSEAILQGWAVLENTTGQDWNDVKVTLMSGSPVTYHQALYESYHVDRPELPVKIMDRVMPRTDQGVMQSASNAGGMGSSMNRTKRSSMMQKTQMMFDESNDYMESDIMPSEVFSMTPAQAPSFAPSNMAQTISAAASETASQMVFKFPHGVDLKASHSLMLPYAQLTLPTEELYVYQPDTHSTHPFASMLVTNNSNSALPPGILTLYDRANSGEMLHIGDAEMPLIPKSEDRLINFALDTQTKISQVQQENRRLGLIKLNRGVLTQEVVYDNTTTYTIKAPAEDSRTVLLEHPLRPSWEMLGELKDKVDTTLTHYRIRVNVKPGESKKIPVTLRRKGHETVSLVNISSNEITARLKVSGENIPNKIKEALSQISKMRQSISSNESKLNQLRAERNRITQDQNRVRENLRTISQDSAIGKRYLANLDKQETQLENILSNEETVQEKLTAQRDALSTYVNGLSL
tara:strand:- start:83783 stop:85894 length:2112 start_codon:yes stop_codon:yes gene_type:complete